MAIIMCNFSGFSYFNRQGGLALRSIRLCGVFPEVTAVAPIKEDELLIRHIRPDDGHCKGVCEATIYL